MRKEKSWSRVDDTKAAIDLALGELEKLTYDRLVVGIGGAYARLNDVKNTLERARALIDWIGREVNVVEVRQ